VCIPTLLSPSPSHVAVTSSQAFRVNRFDVTAVAFSLSKSSTLPHYPHVSWSPFLANTVQDPPRLALSFRNLYVLTRQCRQKTFLSDIMRRFLPCYLPPFDWSPPISRAVLYAPVPAYLRGQHPTSSSRLVYLAPPSVLPFLFGL